MKLAPLSRYPTPRYPTESILRENPAFLTALPKRWCGNRLALGTLSGALLLLAHAGCTQQSSTIWAPPDNGVMFTYMGFSGLLLGQPIVKEFLTEQEARKVAEEEARRLGFDLSQRGHIAKDVVAVEWRKFLFLKDQDKMDLELDGWDKRSNIGYALISQENIGKWYHKGGGHILYPDGNAISPSAVLKKKLKDAGAKNIGVLQLDGFDDPTDKPEAEEKLRQQTRDFLAWLKAQGVI